MDRFKSPQIQDEAHLIKVMTYIDLNPYRANKVQHPKQNRYSSYAYYAYGKKDLLITPAPIYVRMGETPKDRQRNYREMVAYVMKWKGRERRNYSMTCFIGDPLWVIQQNNQLRKKMKAKGKARQKNDEKHALNDSS